MAETLNQTRSRRGLTLQAAAILGALLLVGILTIQGSRAAFTASTTNGVNNFTSGSVLLADDDAGAIMFNLTGMAPGTTATRCINVTYTGTLTSDVKLYGTVAGTGLATYLTTVIDIGTGATGGNTFNCTGFTGGVNVFNNTLATFGTTHTNYTNGLGGYTGATNPTTRSYRVTITLQDNNLAQARNASTTFTWEAQNT